MTHNITFQALCLMFLLKPDNFWLLSGRNLVSKRIASEKLYDDPTFQRSYVLIPTYLKLRMSQSKKADLYSKKKQKKILDFFTFRNFSLFFSLSSRRDL
jgi:hypothetical protein